MVITELELRSGCRVKFTNPSAFVISQSNVDLAVCFSPGYIVSKNFNVTGFLGIGQPHGCVTSGSIAGIKVTGFPRSCRCGHSERSKDTHYDNKHSRE